MAPAKTSNFFEDGLTRLEDLVSKLENDDLSLEESLQGFEEGMGLIRKLTNKLNEAHEKIELLTKNQAGEAKTEAFKPAETGE